MSKKEKEVGPLFQSINQGFKCRQKKENAIKNKLRAFERIQLLEKMQDETKQSLQESKAQKKEGLAKNKSVLLPKPELFIAE